MENVVILTRICDELRKKFYILTFTWRRLLTIFFDYFERTVFIWTV
jgi:hypothetical protein